MKLGHVHLKVKDLDVAVNFYAALLGLKETERLGNHFSFLSFGSAHHDIALQALGHHATNPVQHAVGLYHSAFEVTDAQKLLDTIEKLEQLKHTYALVDHGISWAIYTADPDGNGVEVFLDRRTAPSGLAQWNGASRQLSKQQILTEIGRS
ncbi:MAG: VOC family protein [Bdellovibrionales bacterium]|nr:VOC family protein [Bdellovibrionales bacterium]